MVSADARPAPKHRRISVGKVLIVLVLFSFSLLCVIPMLSIVSASLSNNVDVLENGFRLIPEHLSFESYRYIFNDPKMVVDAYGVTIFVTVVGTVLSLLVTAGLSYALSRPDFKPRNVLSFFIFFTTLFSGGLVPWYMLINNYLQLGNKIWALIIPSLAGVWNIILLRTFFQKLPFEIIESCYLDGANEFRIFFTMVLPLSKPGLATIALFITLGYWNDWWLSLLFVEKQSLTPLSLLLYRMLNNIDYLTTSTKIPSFMKPQDLPSETARMATALIAAGPMLFVFPFFQKYFVKGLTVGAVKG